METIGKSQNLQHQLSWERRIESEACTASSSSLLADQVVAGDPNPNPYCCRGEGFIADDLVGFGVICKNFLVS